MGHTAALFARVRRTSWRSLALAGISSAGPLGCGAVGPEHPAAQGGSAQGQGGSAQGQGGSAQGQGGSAQGGSAQGGSAQGGSVGGVEEAPAGSAGLAAGGRRPIGSDSNLPPPQGSGGAQPDLVPQKITRDSTYYYLTYCNKGAATSGSTFTIKTTNIASNESFTSNPLYPFSVPAPGTCATTGGLTCGLIGDPTCSLHIAVGAKVDPDNTVVESNELNNAMIVLF